MVATRRMLTGLAWALAVLAVISAAIQLLLASGILLTPFDIPDFVDRLVAIRGDQERLLPWILLGVLATSSVYFLVAMLGVVIRGWSVARPARDVMALLLVIGGVIGIGSQLVHAGIHDAARPFYCDCGYRAEEVIGLDSALHVGESIFTWLTTGALAFVAGGVAAAGRALSVSPTWRMVSYGIAVAILVAVVLRVLAAFVFIEAFDPFQVSDVIVALATGILVPIWAILLARGVVDPDAEPLASTV